MYCFTRWKRTRDGLVASVPKHFSYSLVAEPGFHSSWCLVSLGADIDELPKGTTDISPLLKLLLASGEDYPPALALAAEELYRHGQTQWTPDEITEFMVESLQRHFRHQPTAEYFLAEVVRSEPIYLTVGEFVWIVGLRHDPNDPGQMRALWVSGDYNLYENSANYFEISSQRFKPFSPMYAASS